MGMQKPLDDTTGAMPTLVKETKRAVRRGAHRSEMFLALFNMMENDPWNIKIVRKIASFIVREKGEAGTMDDDLKLHQQKLMEAARNMVRHAEELATRGMISDNDAEIVIDALSVVGHKEVGGSREL